MQLTFVDGCVIGVYFLINLSISLWYHKRATASTKEFFVGGNKASWWLAGTSMVATTFAADTPLAVTGFVAANGIAGNWVWWSMLMSGMLTVFFFARLWRRSGVLTDVEFAEIRYSGTPAAFLRGFRALYLGLPVNCIVMGWINLAMVKILMVTFPDLRFDFIGIEDHKLSAMVIVFGLMFITASLSSLSGVRGALVADFFQFILMMGMVIVLAVFSVRAVGGMPGLLAGLEQLDAGKQGSILSFVPDLHSAWMPLITFLVYIAVNWWATWYPGAEPGGGGYIVQRILCARNEKHSLLATLWFNIAHYAVRPWPWILTALASLVLYPQLQDKEAGYVQTIMDPRVLPVALRGLMIAAFVAAYASTMATQLNWGASYVVNDFYRRFWVKGKAEKHYVRISQGTTLLLMLLSSVVTYHLDSIGGAWRFLIAVGAGTGGVFILRWFWWRINAWSEIVAMATAFVVSMGLEFGLFKYLIVFDASDDPRKFAYSVLITALCSTAAWVVVTLVTAPVDRAKLLAFYRRVRPSAALWGPVAREAVDVTPSHDAFSNLLDFVAGCVMVYMALFGVGKIIFGQTLMGILFLAIAVVAGLVIYCHLNRRGWKVID